MSDGPQKLSTALTEQRRAIEPEPGSADNDWPLYRDRTAQLVIVAQDLTRLGPAFVQPRELIHAFVNPVLGGFAVIAFSHPSGFWVNEVRNLTANFCCVAAFSDLGAVLSLAGWATSATAIRSGFRADPNLVVTGGTTTASQPLTFEIVQVAQPGSIFRGPLWVEPGRVFAVTNHILSNTLLDFDIDVQAPITRGVGV